MTNLLLNIKSHTFQTIHIEERNLIYAILINCPISYIHTSQVHSHIRIEPNDERTIIFTYLY